LISVQYRAQKIKMPGASNLLVLLDILNASTKGVARVALTVSRVLDGQLGEVGNHVLDLGVGLGAGLAAKVVQSGDGGEDVVDHSDDDSDTQGVTPDDNNGDNVDVVVVGESVGSRVRGVGLGPATEPAEDGEQSGQDIDNENGNNQLPRGPGLTTTGDEDQPVLSKGNLEEDNLLRRSPVLDDTTIGQEHGSTDNPGSGSEETTKNDGDNPDLGNCHSTGRASK